MTATIKQFSSMDNAANAVADALVVQLETLQKLGRIPRVVLTGGRTAARINSAIAREPGVVDWENVEIWFSDERYLPEGSLDRNYERAHASLFSHMQFDYARLHPMPSATHGLDNDVERAASQYAAELVAAAPKSGPWFDFVILSVGPDGHCASLFPGRVDPVDPAPVVAVQNAPKLPSTRLSMSMSTLGKAREVWFIASGAEKAEAVVDAMTCTDVCSVPAAGPKGLERTVWFLDDAAAGLLAGNLR